MAAPIAPLRIVALDKTHDRSRFTCGVEALDRYLKQQARQDADKRVAAAFVLVAPPAPQVLGYFTLSASVITFSTRPPPQERQRTVTTAGPPQVRSSGPVGPLPRFFPVAARVVTSGFGIRIHPILLPVWS